MCNESARALRLLTAGRDSLTPLREDVVTNVPGYEVQAKLTSLKINDWMVNRPKDTVSLKGTICA